MIETIPSFVTRIPQLVLSQVGSRATLVDDQIGLSVPLNGQQIFLSTFAKNKMLMGPAQWLHIIRASVTLETNDGSGSLAPAYLNLNLFGQVATFLTSVKVNPQFSGNSFIAANVCHRSITIEDQWFRQTDYSEVPLVGGASNAGFTLQVELEMINSDAVAAHTFNMYYRILFETLNEARETTT